MPMIIRLFKPEDFDGVVNLLSRVDVEPPHEESDLNGLCLVAVEAGQIIGCIWALLGSSTQSYVDYFAVAPEYKGGRLAFYLLKVLDKILLLKGIKRYDFYVEPYNKEFIDLIKHWDDKRKNVERLRDLLFFRRTI